MKSFSPLSRKMISLSKNEVLLQKKITLPNELEITYLDSNSGSTNTLFFIHGNSFSSQTFRKQFNDPAFSEFRLIAVDLFGHGSSSPLQDKSYSIPKYASLVNELVHILKLQNVLLAGHSLGGHVALEAIGASGFSSVFKGIFLWGTPPLSRPPLFEKAFLPHPDSALFFKKKLSEEEIERLVSSSFVSHDFDHERYVKMISETDPEAREALFDSFSRLEYLDEEELVNQLVGKVFILNCLKDQFISSEYQKKYAGAEIHGGHFAHEENSKEFNSYLKDFAKRVFSNV